jgi:hypothetical protein
MPAIRPARRRVHDTEYNSQMSVGRQRRNVGTVALALSEELAYRLNSVTNVDLQSAPARPLMVKLESRTPSYAARAQSASRQGMSKQSKYPTRPAARLSLACDCFDRSCGYAKKISTEDASHSLVHNAIDFRRSQSSSPNECSSTAFVAFEEGKAQ